MPCIGEHARLDNTLGLEIYIDLLKCCSDNNDMHIRSDCFSMEGEVHMMHIRSDCFSMEGEVHMMHIRSDCFSMEVRGARDDAH